MAQPLDGHPPKYRAGVPAVATRAVAPAGGARDAEAPAARPRPGSRHRRASAVSLAAFLGLSGFLMVEPHAGAAGHDGGRAVRAASGAAVSGRPAPGRVDSLAPDTVTRAG